MLKRPQVTTTNVCSIDDYSISSVSQACLPYSYSWIRGADHQIHFMEAARKFCNKRFAPSELEIRPLLNGMADITALKGLGQDASNASGLACTHFYYEIFMYYLAFGSGKPELLKGLAGKLIMWDVDRDKAGML